MLILPTAGLLLMEILETKSQYTVSLYSSHGMARANVTIPEIMAALEFSRAGNWVATFRRPWDLLDSCPLDIKSYSKQHILQH